MPRRNCDAENVESTPSVSSLALPRETRTIVRSSLIQSTRVKERDVVLAAACANRGNQQPALLSVAELSSCLFCSLAVAHVRCPSPRPHPCTKCPRSYGHRRNAVVSLPLLYTLSEPRAPQSKTIPDASHRHDCDREPAP